MMDSQHTEVAAHSNSAWNEVIEINDDDDEEEEVNSHAVDQVLA